MSVAHVWGTPYEMGFAQGRIMKERVTGFIETLWDYFITEITNEIHDFAPNLPPEFVDGKVWYFYQVQWGWLILCTIFLKGSAYFVRFFIPEIMK